MNKHEEEELLKWKAEQERKEAVREAMQGKVILRCSTVIIAIWTALISIGAWASEHFKGLEAAIIAFIEAEYKR